MAMATNSWGLMRFAFLPCSLVVVIMFLNLKSTTVTAHSPAHADRDRLSLLKTQASILIALKQSFQSHHPSLLTTWNLSNYFLLCSWTGLRCDPATNSSIVSLDLSSFNISGSLSPLISDLPALLNLSLSGNSFSGDFPPAIIHKLSSLQFLNISGNQFTGVPAQWDLSRLKELRVLDAYDNCFNGSLPLAVTQLPKLTQLDFGGNYFTGTIPLAYGSMKTEQLTYLSLKGNDLRGSIPAELGNLTSLRQLYLGYYNEFEGGIPHEFGKLVNLVHLDLANCGLKGPIPPELGNLNMLDTLFLQTNELTGSIPPTLGNLTNMNSLDLSNNALTGSIPLEFSGLRQLTLVNLFLNRLHGEIPHFIADLPQLQVLKLWHNNFTGTIPGELGQNGKLVELDLSSNKLTGLVPKSLCWGRRLQILILRINFLFGPLPEDLGRCHTLVRVRMGQNYLTGPIPAGFLYLPELSLMELQDNHLSGSLPEEQQTSDLPCCSKLEELNLSDNRLSGTLPASSIGNFSKLQSLLLSGNQFTGGIPSEVGQLRNVLTLDVSRNNLSGTIPPEIGNCPVLTYLDLSANQLSGPIPLEITQIHILNYLNLSWNRLNQSLPKEIGSMKSLTSADFSHNNFSGMVPEFGQYTFFNSTSFVGNPLLCGFYKNPCNSSSSSSMSPLQLHNQSGSSSSSRSLLQVARKLKLVAVVGLVGCMLVFVGLAIAKAWKMRRNMRLYSWRMTPFQKLEFESEDIVECIKESNIIGRGGAGIVYRGLMPNGEQVAVKKLLGISGGKGGGSSSHRHRHRHYHHHHDDKGLSAEIQILGRIRHRNIVRLLAFCSNRETNLLVYEYMPNGSLGEALHGKINSNGNKGGGGGGGLLLHWDTRLKIAIEAAKGLAYLHHDCSPLIIHRDVKSNNILLNSEFEAHVADFGLAKFWQEQDAAGTSQYMSAIAGSYGYIAPEYAYTLKVDEKSDVYSFGVVLLELITGRRPVGDFGEEGLDIVQWAKLQTNSSKAGVAKILDHRLTTEGDVPLHEAMQVFFVATLCVDEHSVQRPTMREVVQMLSQAKQPNTFRMN